jgi:hypothetical protein
MPVMARMFCIIAFRVHEHVRVHVEHGVLNLPERGAGKSDYLSSGE